MGALSISAAGRPEVRQENSNWRGYWVISMSCVPAYRQVTHERMTSTIVERMQMTARLVPLRFMR